MYLSTFANKAQREGYARGSFLQQTTSGIAAAHAAGYCHCDLRPENIVVVDHNVVIIDWGLSGKVGEKRHKHNGGLLFFHDEILMRSPEDNTDLLITKEQDTVSIEYIAVAIMSFDTSRGCNAVPWRYKTGSIATNTDVVASRREHTAFRFHGGPEPAAATAAAEDEA
jgi:serine/threonine protein kinase